MNREQWLANRQKRYGIRTLSDYVKAAAFNNKVLASPGLILTDVPYGPLNVYDTVVVDAVYFSRVACDTMIVLVNPDADVEEPIVSRLSTLTKELDGVNPLYVRLDPEYYHRVAEAFMSIDGDYDAGDYC